MKASNISLRLIEILADGLFHSGEQLGRELKISRAAINKHISIIREWGLNIEAVSGKGYKLLVVMQLLKSNIIRQHLKYNNKLIILPIISSTNQYLLDNMNVLSSGDVCLAEFQYAGRGRRGRQWFSPFGTNLYMSMFWYLEQGPMATMGLSLVIAISIAEVLQGYGANNVGLKWPNDLYLNQRKLAGILVEIIGKTGDAAKIIISIGIGINLFMHNVDKTIIDQAWTNLIINGVKIERNKLAADLINHLKSTLINFECNGLLPYIERWNKLDCFYNQPVKLLIGEQQIEGIARGIDKQGNLLLEQDGKITTWFNGEISLRSQDD